MIIKYFFSTKRAVYRPDETRAGPKICALPLSLMSAFYKHVYFVPFKQDNPQKKPNSMIASLEYLIPAAEAALEGRQYQPIIQ